MVRGRGWGRGEREFIHKDNLACMCIVGSREEIMEACTCLCVVIEGGRTREFEHACLCCDRGQEDERESTE